MKMIVFVFHPSFFYSFTLINIIPSWAVGGLEVGRRAVKEKGCGPGSNRLCSICMYLHRKQEYTRGRARVRCKTTQNTKRLVYMSKTKRSIY